MKEIFSITIPGKPIAKKRPRFVRRGNFVGAYNCQETEEGRFKWELASKMAGKDPIPSGVPIRLAAMFYMPIPSSVSKKRLSSVGHRHVKKPDLDNLVKFVKDCANGLLWNDDSQVFCVSASKYYSDNPRTELTVQAEDYVWKRGQREESRKRLAKIHAIVDSLVADIKALRPRQDPIQQAPDSAKDQYDYNVLRPGQTRGVPYLSPVIERLKQLDRYTDAELMALADQAEKRIEAITKIKRISLSGSKP